MKRRLILVSALIVVAALFGSCKKMCVCTFDVGGETTRLEVGEMSKAQCAAYKLAGQDDFECKSE
ncbi:MAG TPA: hypothetical protein PLH70_01945 [Bacteroidales bacterium]|nr:hypothetical protein [Bacteroidales bacterium]HQB74547.1 hypothetical protein [Bacteroidales bacterium]